MKILTTDYKDKDFSILFQKSLHNSGFAIIKNHPISTTLINRCYEDWNTFFSSNKKFDYLFDYDAQDGYFPYKSENAKNYKVKDLKEFYHIYRIWGRYPNFIRNNALILFDELTNLGEELLKCINDNSPENVKKNFTMPLQDMANNSDQNLLRIIHYPPLGKNEEKQSLRAAPHADINLITLLLAGSTKGLQVKTNNNNWMDVDFKDNELVVNIGDMLQLSSNNYYPSTIHQVVNPDEKNNLSRYSMPLFIHPRKDVKLTKKLTANEYLNQRLRQLGLK